MSRCIDINQFQSEYKAQLPVKIPEKAAQGFILTGTIHLLKGQSFAGASILGLIAATATLVEAATRPILDQLFQDTPVVRDLLRLGILVITTITLVNTFAPWALTAGKFQMSLPALIGFFAINTYSHENKAMGMVL